ncbi:MAG: hypothetical protein K0Q72_3335, partial [Armatimonadetes bacterium]|nr:hypothetical protein [Armatimonadota bacterium]
MAWNFDLSSALLTIATARERPATDEGFIDAANMSAW